MEPNHTPQREPSKPGRSLAIALSVAALGVVVLMYVGFGLSSGDWWPLNGAPARTADWDGIARTAIPGAAFVAAVVAAVFGYHAQVTRDKELDASRDAAVTERYTKAVEQLAHDDDSVRLGGIYALERIAHDSERDRDTIIDVLCAQLRAELTRTAARTKPRSVSF